MLFAIHALDGKDGPGLRATWQDAHLAHLKTAASYRVQIVMSGPLIEDTGTAMKGSLLVVEAEGRANVERFNNADPYRSAGIWETVHITGFLKKNG